MPKLLNSLEVREYRLYKELLVERLGLVNLFVGKNNVGKSSILEALWIYSQRAHPSTVISILQSRDETRVLPFALSGAEGRERIWDIKYLFHGRRDVRDSFEPIVLGPIDKPNATLRINVEWFILNDDDEGNAQSRYIPDPQKGTSSEPYLVISLGDKRLEMHRLERVFSRGYRGQRRAEFEGIPNQLITANGLGAADIAKLWDNIALTDLEESVVSGLQIIAPEVRRVSFIGPELRSGRVAVARVSSLDEPLPLRSMGEGLNRILGLVLALANAKDGMLLVDEIESGLHYTVQTNVWRLLFRLARRLNVQVFATTHSWDCIESFQKAAVEDMEEGLLIRLEKKDERVEVTLFDEHRLSVATREQIEVR